MTTATFARNCSWEPGDEFVYHAVGVDGSRVVAIGEVLSACRHDPPIDGAFGFEYVCDVRVTKKRRLVADALPLEELNGHTRDLRRSTASMRPHETDRASSDR